MGAPRYRRSSISRTAVSRQSRAAQAGAATCSGYIVAPDGSGLCNPGVRTRWVGPTLPAGVPVVVADDPARYGDLVSLALDDPAA